jgi:hypothetical protein
MAGEVVPYATDVQPIRWRAHQIDREAAIVAGIKREFGAEDFGALDVRRSLRGGRAADPADVAQHVLLPELQHARRQERRSSRSTPPARWRCIASARSRIRMVTPRNMHWHGLQGDDYVMKDRATRLWFENTTKALFRQRYDANANFAAQNYNNWQSLGAFGNSTMYVDRYRQPLARRRPRAALQVACRSARPSTARTIRARSTA